MGCCGSTAQEPKVVERRRRLSIGDVQNEADDKATITDDDRGFVTNLSEQSVMELLKANQGAAGDRQFSIGSQTDQSTTSFGNKKVQQMGDEFDAATAGMGFTCRKGLKPESPNQDSWCILQVGNFMIYAVFDGHGKHGHHVSNFVKENLPKLILRDGKFKSDEMQAMLMDIFKKIQRAVETADRMGKISAQLSGTTSTVAIHDLEKHKLTVAHVADSTCVMGSLDPNGQLKGVPLTRDHKPDLKDEKKRIEQQGGVVIYDGYANHRVYAKGKRRPGLNMSRCLGDLLGHQEAGLSCEPETTEMMLSDNDDMLLLCSDGVWEFILPQEACDIIKASDPNQTQATAAAENLAKEAWNRWIAEEGGSVVDDITVVLIYLKKAKAVVARAN
mmetsp:Transcript_71676/g.134039  ORF Transcript_71676/g.134039 Transcript_71676/m.134039 type:complete len:388 (-) Transcript_71676:67-1230(-)